MKEIDCIAKIMIARVAQLYLEKGKILLKENSRLAEYTKEMDRAACMDFLRGETVTAKRYRFLTEQILDGDKAAGNVLDLSLAAALYPDFAVELKKLSLHDTTVKNGWFAQGVELPEYEQMKKTYDVLCSLYLVNRNAYPFYDVSFYADNRLLGYLCGEDAFDAQTARYAGLYLAEGETGSKTELKEKKSAVLQKVSSLLIQKVSVQLKCNDAKNDARELLKACASCERINLVFAELHCIRQERLSDIMFGIIREALLYRAYVCFNGVEESFLKAQKLTVSQFYEIFVRPLEERQIPVCLCTEESIRIQKMMHTKTEVLSIAANGRFRAEKGELVEPVEGMTLDALVTCEANKEIMKKICWHKLFADRVFKDWEMDSFYPYGKGVCALFAGPPGTGKTMAAHVISNMLHLPLYHVDLSQVADKYIGETEKNLEKIFRYAEENPVVLFFDEADALFGKRSEVKDAKDRYANTEISFILQRIEQYEGIVILATNLKGNMDPAFMRRMKYSIYFSMPDEAMRYEIWKKGFSKAVPTDNIDFSYLARQFELSGGNIKNIILTAVFDAAGRGEAVGMTHILDAVVNEFAKYNKMMAAEEFGEYAYLR